MKSYLELAKNQFLVLREEILDEDRHSLGGEDEIEYENTGIKIRVDGFWEDSMWFDYFVHDMDGNLIEKGDYYY